jgi:suppressor for copper-sensitivity B
MFGRMKTTLFLLAALMAATSARADTSAWDREDFAAARLISAVTATGDSTTLPFGLEFELQPEWKIYWRSPGDAGLPPIPDWSQSENVASVTMDWPVPARFEIFDIGTLGYEDHVVFPLTVTPEIPGAPISLRGTVDYLACSDICIPGRASLSLELPAGTATGGAHAHLIDRFAAGVPLTDPVLAGLSVTDAVARIDAENGLLVDIAIRSDGGALTAPDVFVEGPGGAYFDTPTATVAPDGRAAVLTVAAPDYLDLASLTGDGMTVTVVDGVRALETSITPGEGPPLAISGAAASPESGRSLWTILWLALLGGLILNLMPCVLPVLSLKLMSVVSKSGKEAGTIRAGFLASSAGIVVSFLALAGAAIAVKQAGLAVGWGIQFQQPVFLALMVALLTLFACNLLGLFEFRPPSTLITRLAAPAPAGKQSLFGDFLTGAFATLLATPCSAPFLGTAVGFALAAGAGEIVAVFAALGLGLALPYLLIAAFPSLVNFLPKPGNWMRVLRVVLALALIGTAVWLLTVMATTLGTEGAISVGALAALAGAVLATRKLEGSRLGRIAWPASTALAVITVLSPLGITPIQVTRDAVVQEDATGIRWEVFDETRIPALVAEGKTVFVDVTADWCVTCQFNKRAVMDVGAVASWLASDQVVAMRADWTRPDPVIADYLARHGRYGIPFNIVHGPAAPDGVPLPELLTAGAVEGAALAADPETRLADAE